MNLINFSIYEPLAIISYGVCASVWFCIYLSMMWKVRKNQYSEMHIIPLCGYIAWEVLWGYVYRTDMGELFVWGLKVFAPLSCYVGWEVYRHGHKQFYTSTVRKNVPALMGFVLAAWMLVLYFFIPAVDDGAGITTATLLTMLYSSFALHLLLKIFEHEGVDGLKNLSFPMGVARTVANLGGAGFCFLHLPERRWVLALCVVTTAMDIAYILIFHRLRSSATGTVTEANADGGIQQVAVG